MSDTERRVNSLKDGSTFNWNPFIKFFDRENPKYKKLKERGMKMANEIKKKKIPEIEVFNK